MVDKKRFVDVGAVSLSLLVRCINLLIPLVLIKELNQEVGRVLFLNRAEVYSWVFLGVMGLSHAFTYFRRINEEIYLGVVPGIFLFPLFAFFISLIRNLLLQGANVSSLLVPVWLLLLTLNINIQGWCYSDGKALEYNKRQFFVFAANVVFLLSTLKRLPSELAVIYFLLPQLILLISTRSLVGPLGSHFFLQRKIIVPFMKFSFPFMLGGIFVYPVLFYTKSKITGSEEFLGFELWDQWRNVFLIIPATVTHILFGELMKSKLTKVLWKSLVFSLLLMMSAELLFITLDFYGFGSYVVVTLESRSWFHLTLIFASMAQILGMFMNARGETNMTLVGNFCWGLLIVMQVYAIGSLSATGAMKAIFCAYLFMFLFQLFLLAYESFRSSEAKC